MQIGAVFPQTEIGEDPGAVRAFAEAATALGYAHLLAYDHVLGADASVHHGWPGPYDLNDAFHEPFVLFGYLAGLTNLAFATAILVSPQRQTALVAKQAAEVDLLTGGGRLRLGLGLGWNTVEYEAMGAAFATRARRLEEQIALLRLLWTEPSVTYVGDHHAVTGAGLVPLPTTRPIPIWLGAGAPAALRRVGRLADGWFPQAVPGHGLEEAAAAVTAAAIDAGRDPTSIGMEGMVLHSPDPAKPARYAARWRDAGATHVSLLTMGASLRTADEHIDALRSAAPALHSL